MTRGRFVVGLTGGIGTGKSSVLAEFERLGAATISLDQLAREQARPGRDGWSAIVCAFGRGILDRSGRIDRRALGIVVFRDPAARRRLERATHPLILKEMTRLISRLTGLVVVDVPLLFEKGLERHFDVTVLVSCRVSTQARRVIRRDGMSAAEVRRRMSAQWPTARKKALADFTISNDGTLAQLRAGVKSLHAVLTLFYGGMTNGNADQLA